MEKEVLVTYPEHKGRIEHQRQTATAPKKKKTTGG